MNERYKDTDLREALRRKYADQPQLPADFMAKMQSRLEPQPVAKTRKIWRWMAAAACLLLIAGIGLTLVPEKEQQNDNQATALQTHETTTADEVITTTKTARPKDACKARTGTTKSTLPTQSTLSSTEPNKLSKFLDKPSGIAERSKLSSKKTTELSTLSSKETDYLPDENLHYAALSTTEDSVPYQAPSRVDDFIAKLAAYNEVESTPLKCSSEQGADSTIVSTAFLFDEKNGLDLFGRLLQVACCYDSKTPGYLLNFSHKQFVFCLEDHQKGLKYLWVAERLSGNRILLFATHSPIETNVSSTCFQEYREQLTHKGINMLNF